MTRKTRNDVTTTTELREEPTKAETKKAAKPVGKVSFVGA